jgi:hypothetical protein
MGGPIFKQSTTSKFHSNEKHAMSMATSQKNCPKENTEQPEAKEQEQWQLSKRKKTTNKSGPQLQDRREIPRPTSPLKEKSPMMGNNEAESSKNGYEVLGKYGGINN